MKKHIILFISIYSIFLFSLTAQQQTSDGGYIIAGTTESLGNGDALVLKLNASGAKQWRKNFGGIEFDMGTRIAQTSDGGYILCGLSRTYTNGDCDFLVYKLNAAGQKQWRKNLGGEFCDHAFCVIQTTDGGYLVAGDTHTYVHGLEDSDRDFLLYKLDAAGAKQWRKNFGGEDGESAFEIQQTTDGGYVVIGYTASFSNGYEDFLIYKLDASGQKQWRKNLGGYYAEYGYSIQQTSDGGYICCGETDSYVHEPKLYGERYADFLIYKLDATGKKVWRKNYGGTDHDRGYSIRQTSDGGYIICGDSRSYSHGVGDYDFLIYKLDATGAKVWRKNYGGSENDNGYFVFKTADGGYFIYGFGYSYHSGTGDTDLLIYKLDAAGSKLWRKNYGGADYEWCAWED